MSTRKRGFTLVELLVVIGIIALLIAILMPALSRARKQALQASCGSNARQITYGCLAYANDWKEQLPTRLGYQNDSGNWPPENLGGLARLPVIGFDTTTIWDWGTYIQTYRPSNFWLGGMAFVMRDYLKNDWDIYYCPDGFYTKDQTYRKWGGTYWAGVGPLQGAGWGPEYSALVVIYSGYMQLAHRRNSYPLCAVSCAAPGVAATDKPGDVAKTASDLPELQIMADFNVFTDRYYSGCGLGGDPTTCGIAANHPGTSYKGLPGFDSMCMPQVFPPNIGRVEKPLDMPLGQNSSRIDARTTWKAWQDWKYYRFSLMQWPGYDAESHWHSF